MKIQYFLLFTISSFAFSLAGQNFTEKIFLDSNFNKCDSVIATHISYIAFADSSKRAGLVKTNLLNGQFESEIYYSDIEKKIENGETKLFKKGLIKIISNFKNGLNHGNFISYYETGQMKRKDFYENGNFIKGHCYAKNGSDTAYYNFEIMPHFPGGDQNFFEFIRNNMKYPSEEKENNISGKVFITFIVGKDGIIGDIKPLREVENGAGLTTEAIRVISAMPKWEPGMQDGEAVNVAYNIPINFTLVGKKKRRR